MPIEEVPLRTQASPAHLEREDHAETASDGFALLKSDSSFFIRQGRNMPVSILLYVDDLVIAGANLDEIGCIKSQLMASLEMKDLGDLHYFLRIEVICNPESILINQQHYVLSILYKFSMMECKSVSTPLDRCREENRPQEESEEQGVGNGSTHTRAPRST